MVRLLVKDIRFLKHMTVFCESLFVSLGPENECLSNIVSFVRIVVIDAIFVVGLLVGSGVCNAWIVYSSLCSNSVNMSAP